jgi:hypothetical protein
MSESNAVTVDTVPVKRDMRALYDQLRDGKVTREKADSLANISGKILKAVQLELAERIFLKDMGHKAGELPAPKK